MRKFRTTVYAGLAAVTLVSALLTGCGEQSIPAALTPSTTEADVSATEAKSSTESLSTVEVDDKESEAKADSKESATEADDKKSESKAEAANAECEVLETGDTESVSYSDNSVTVSATGKVTSVPDMAEISFGISTEDTDAKSAQKQNSKEAKKVIEKLKELGVSENSIETSYYDIYPQYDYDEDGGSRIVGYNVDTILTVSDLKIDEAGNVISECVEAGINNMNDISYFCSTYDDDYNEALKEAVKEARKKAEILATASGKTLGEVKYITEGYQDTSYQYSNTKSVSLEAAAEGADAVILPGETDIEANVIITYAMS